MASSRSRSVGQFLWNVTSGQWYWDAAMYELHGYRDGAVAVSTELVLQHKQDKHRAHALAVLKSSAVGDQRFSNYHGIVGADGRERTVLVVGESRADFSRPALSDRISQGFMVDVTDDESDSIGRALDRSRQSTAAIQQTTGVLMAAFGMSEEAAFVVISSVSHSYDVSVRDLAERTMAAATSGAAFSPRGVAEQLIVNARRLATDRDPGPQD